MAELTAQQPHAPLPPIAMSDETDKLFQKWLKMQIAAMYANMLMKVFIFVVVVASLVFSAVTLAPIVESQLSVLSNMLGTLNGLNSITGAPRGRYTPPDQTQQDQVQGDETEAQSDNQDVFGIIDKLSDDQKAALMEMLK